MPEWERRKEQHLGLSEFIKEILMSNTAEMYGWLTRLEPAGEEGNGTAEPSAELAWLVWVRVRGSGHIESLLMVKGG